MSNESAVRELRRSVSLLATEWWLLVGGVAACLLLSVWVVATGVGLESVAPELAATSVTTVGATGISGLVVFGTVAWVLLPAGLTVWLLDRQLSNTYGNLVSRYRLDNPGVLVAPSGIGMLVAAGAALVVGPTVPVIAVLLVASVHLFVRTIAYGRRVYSFSSPWLFAPLVAISSVSLSAGWLLQARTLPGTAGQQLRRAGVGTVVETGLTVAGVAPETALGLLVAVPAMLSGAYLAVQSAVAYWVRAKAPLAQPTKRAEQRLPIMPPVPDSERPGTAATASSGSTDGPGKDGSTGGETGDSRAGDADSDTRVFTADGTEVGSGEIATEIIDTESDDDGWIDDTAVFSPDEEPRPATQCPSCAESIPGDTDVAFCPNCGEELPE